MIHETYTDRFAVENTPTKVEIEKIITQNTNYRDTKKLTLFLTVKFSSN